MFEALTSTLHHHPLLATAATTLTWVALVFGFLTEAALALEVLLLLVRHAKDRLRTIRSHLRALRGACSTLDDPE